ncbi:hypothetical protein VPH35_072996 [Triticum aestivum]|uniref:Uncharacterized protein n=1 Tax=Triticum aestivum TaxID=4565 RepID=A0A3B6IQK1_WHEAT|nr:uncharacterized protein LOC123092092 isoform X2 [Triticum aestivum]
MGGAYWLTLLNSGRVSLDWAAKMANSGASGATGISSDTLYKELWHACARPLITVPHQGERIYYFHMVIWNRGVISSPSMHGQWPQRCCNRARNKDQTAQLHDSHIDELGNNRRTCDMAAECMNRSGLKTP